MEIVPHASAVRIATPLVVFLLPIMVATAILLLIIFLVARTGRTGSMRLFVVLGGVAAALWAWWFLTYILALFFFFDFGGFTSLEPVLWASVTILVVASLYLLWLILHYRRHSSRD